MAELTEVAPHLHLQMLADVYRSGHDFDIIHAHHIEGLAPVGDVTAVGAGQSREKTCW